MKTLVVLDSRDGKLKSSAFEVLTAARKLGATPADLAAVIVSPQGSTLASEIAGYGCDKVFVCEDANLANFNALNYAGVIETAAKNFGAKIVLGSASAIGRDLFPRLAARMNAPLMTDLTSLSLEGEALKGTKPLFAGKAISTIKSNSTAIQFATLRPNVFKAEKSNNGSAAVEKLSATNISPKMKTVEIRKGKSSKPDLTEASLIISGGRPLGSAENFKILFECADAFGATVGASRAAVDAGYAAHDMQVGQTGKTVNPNLYIACGISGSIQHMAGMRTSKVIVAINTDKDAPIHTIASYSIIADLFEAVPILTKKFKELLK